MAGKKDDEVAPIIIRKVVKKVAGGHHGGAWKVAYADFVTAMMAFFMLLWLLNVSDKETLEGLADYFTPTSASVSSKSGSGQILAGTAPVKDGAQASGGVAVTAPSTAKEDNPDPAPEKTETPKETNPFSTTITATPDPALTAAADRLRQSLQRVPALVNHQDQIVMEQTPEGLRIQIIDKDRRPMFQGSTANLFDYAVRLIEQVGEVVSTLPNRVSIHGHTDGIDFQRADGYSNWELSSDRANAARRILAQTGVSNDRFSEVVGKAATEPMFPDNPNRSENRRITILIIREAPVVPPKLGGGN